MRFAALLVAVALSPGCLFVGGSGTIGPALQPAAVSCLIPGRTTKAEVLALLGPPNEHRHPDAAAAMSDDELRVSGALAFAHRAERVFTWQQDRLRARGTVLLLLNVAVIDTESELLVVFFDEHDVVREVAWRRAGEDS